MKYCLRIFGVPVRKNKEQNDKKTGNSKQKKKRSVKNAKQKTEKKNQEKTLKNKIFQKV